MRLMYCTATAASVCSSDRGRRSEFTWAVPMRSAQTTGSVRAAR